MVYAFDTIVRHYNNGLIKPYNTIINVVQYMIVRHSNNKHIINIKQHAYNMPQYNQ